MPPVRPALVCSIGNENPSLSGYHNHLQGETIHAVEFRTPWGKCFADAEPPGGRSYPEGPDQDSMGLDLLIILVWE